MTRNGPAPGRPSRWKTIAWNGLSFPVPRTWEPARIGARHLVIESDAGPAMEIKWKPGVGRVSAHRQLRRLLRHGGRSRAAAAGEWPLPEEWKLALARYDALGFSWEGAADAAHGAVITCPTCRSAIMVQFFHPRGSRPDRKAAAVLGGLSDHRADGLTEWAVFDIHALLPEEFVLVRHRFEVGRFRLEFAGRQRRRMTLLRFAPAAPLLSKRSLEELARTLPACGLLEFSALPVGGNPGVEGREAAGLSVLRRLRARIGVAPLRRVRLWHVGARNRLLGVMLEGRREIGTGAMEALCAAYGMGDE
jgi:hypothetical protein